MNLDKPSECYRDYKLNPELPKFSNKIVASKLVEYDDMCYSVYHYDSEILCFDDHVHAPFRSVVFSHPEKRLLSFSPPKSTTNEEFMDETPFLDDECVNVCEKVEGIMVNLFYDDRNNKWTIATKTDVGGKSGVFRGTRHAHSKLSILAMFLEALRCSHRDLNDCAIVNELAAHYSYSFVLQHPDNIITQHVDRPRLFLVAVYDIDPVHNRAIEIPSFVYENWPIFLNIVGVIEFPAKIAETSYDTLCKKYCAQHSVYLGPGVVVHNYAKGIRTVFENAAYQRVLRARKINPIILYQYICLHRIDKVADFAKYFHPFKKQMEKYKYAFYDLVKSLHQAYLDVYVLKTITMRNVNHSIAPHVQYLHKSVYLRYIGTRLSVKVTRDVVRSYVESMEPREILYLMTHHRRITTMDHGPKVNNCPCMYV